MSEASYNQNMKFSIIYYLRTLHVRLGVEKPDNNNEERVYNMVEAIKQFW